MRSKPILLCLGEGGQHLEVKKYSKQFKIESDHFPPFDAYCLSGVHDKRYCRRGKTRVNEDELPAVGIPYAFHRAFITTGSSKETKIFTANQASKMKNIATFKSAIAMNLVEYAKKGFFSIVEVKVMFADDPKFDMTNAKAKKLVEQFKEGIQSALEQHHALKFISKSNLKYLQDKVKAL